MRACRNTKGDVLTPVLGTAWDRANELAFYCDHLPEKLKCLIANHKARRAVPTDELDHIGRTLRGLAGDALRAIGEAHALSSVLFPSTEQVRQKEDAA